MKADPGQAREYRALVHMKSPGRPVARNALSAFVVGGSICMIGQAILNYLTRVARLAQNDAVSVTSGVMVAVGAALTGLGLYDEIGRVGGMGSAIPITGFANSIVSPAMEFRSEGFVLGLGAKMFIIAGPVIVYGLVTATVVCALRILFLRGL